MDRFVNDLLYAARRLRKSPGFTIVVLLTLALGIGANSAIFGVVNTVLLRPFPYREPERLITIDHFYPSLNNLEAGASAPGYRDLRDKGRIFDGVFVETGWGPALTGMGEARRLTGALVSGQFFSTLGVVPALGRALREDEDAPGNNRVVVISHGLWQREFGGDRSVIGRRIDLNGEAYEIVGVMPPDFQDFFNRRAELWAPLALPASAFTDDRRTNEYLSLIARLKPGVAADQAQREMTAFADRLKQDYPNNYGRTWTLKTATLIDKKAGGIRPALLILLGAVGFVLLIACANVANLMLARAAARIKEIAIRSALGASRRILVGQLLAESLLLSIIGGALGLGLAFAGMKAVAAMAPSNVPRVELLGIDWSVVWFTLAASILTGVLFGLVPALRASRTNLQDTLKEGGRTGSADRSGHRLRNSLVVAEMALSLTLLTGAGLLIASFSRLADVDPGFASERLLTFNLSLPAAKYRTDTTRLAYWREVIPALEAVPGVRSVAATSTLPFGGSWSTGSFTVEGYQPAQGQPGPWGDLRLVSNGFHSGMQIKLLKGRTFDDRDNETAPLVAVVDEEAVKRFWPNEDPIGKRITFNNPQQDSSVTWITIVGVVAHTKHEGLDAENRLQVYFPLGQMLTLGFGGNMMALAVRTTGDPRQSLGAIRSAIQGLDPDVPIATIATMEENIAGSMGQRRFSMLLLGLFAALALTLASIGIYGVMSFAVTQRSHELGVRMTLGATRRDVLQLVMRNGMLLVIAGAGIGALGSLALKRVIQSQLFGVSAADPVTWVAVTATLLGVAALATLIPALRATRVDPVAALREE